MIEARSVGENAKATRFNLRNRSGWLRVWLVGAICWGLFAAYQVLEGWDVLPEQVISRPIGGNAAGPVAKAAQEAQAVCVDGTISTNVRADNLDAFDQSQTLDEFLRRREAAAQAPAKLAVGAAAKRNPDEATRQAATARKWGVSPAVVAANPALFDQQDAEDNAARHISRSPELANWLAAREANAAMARDDLDTPTHILTVSCVREITLLRRIGQAAAAILLPPLVLPLIGLLIVVLLVRLGRWLLAGFRAAPHEKAAIQTLGAESRGDSFNEGREIGLTVPDSVPRFDDEFETTASIKKSERFLIILAATFVAAWICTPPPVYATNLATGQILAGFRALGFSFPIAIVIWLFSRRIPTIEHAMLPSWPALSAVLAVGLLQWGGACARLRQQGFEMEDALLTAVWGWQGVLIVLSILGFAYKSMVKSDTSIA